MSILYCNFDIVVCLCFDAIIIIVNVVGAYIKLSYLIEMYILYEKMKMESMLYIVYKMKWVLYYIL